MKSVPKLLRCSPKGKEKQKDVTQLCSNIHPTVIPPEPNPVKNRHSLIITHIDDWMSPAAMCVTTQPFIISSYKRKPKGNSYRNE